MGIITHCIFISTVLEDPAVQKVMLDFIFSEMIMKLDGVRVQDLPTQMIQLLHMIVMKVEDLN